MLKFGRVTKVKMLFLVLVFVFNFDLFKFSAAILEKGLLYTLTNKVFQEFLLDSSLRELNQRWILNSLSLHEENTWKKVNKHVPKSTNSRGSGLEHCSLPQGGFSCVWWSQIQLLHSLQMTNWSTSAYELGFLTRFCSIHNSYLLAYFIVPN